MEKQLSQLREFHQKYSIPYENKPTLEIKEQLKHNFVKMLSEEVEEINRAIFEEKDIKNVSKEMADTMYILLGGIDLFGMRDVFPLVFDEVHGSNMSKIASDIKGNGNGIKPKKSASYRPPQLDRFFGNG